MGLGHWVRKDKDGLKWLIQQTGSKRPRKAATTTTKHIALRGADGLDLR